MRKIIFISILFFIGTINSIAQSVNTQSQWENFFKNKILGLDPLEGIWSNSNTVKFYDSYNNLISTEYRPQAATFAIFKEGNKYMTYEIGNNKTGMTFINTASQGIYLMENYYKKSNSTSKANAVLTGAGLLKFSYEVPIEELKSRAQETTYTSINLKLIYEQEWIKIYPDINDYKVTQPSSGTGFGISSNGIIATNHHVIDGAKIILVKGINSDFNKSYNAKILVSDKNNDLALIQIDDSSFTTLGTIPYLLKTKLSNVGENIFALGYPLRAIMGDEIKLTNGIISSKTGFQGDITSYQVSAPVQSGNSGGPLFDSNGNVIGIINAKLTIAENASYAVKASYLLNLIELLNISPKLPTINTLKGKSLASQVQIINKFVYIIETE